MLLGLPSAWIDATEGADLCSSYVIVGHLIHGERTDCFPRAEKVRAHNDNQTFEPYDRFAQFHESVGK